MARYHPDCGVYVIWSTITGQAYVGSSRDIGRRIKEHFNLFANHHHYCTPLQEAYKRDARSLKYKILELCCEEHLKEYEREYVDKTPFCVNARSPNGLALRRGTKPGRTRLVPKARPAE